jgi:hypothetical protein
MGGVTWVSDINEELYVKFKQGMTTSALAKQYGMTKNAVIGRIDRLRRKVAAGKQREPRVTKQRCTIMELTIDSCRYIVDDTNGYYCGDQRTKGSFCAAHAKLCYRNEKLSDEEFTLRRMLKARKHYRMPSVGKSAAGPG